MEFILQIEDKRLQLGVPETTCCRHFTPLLDEDERARLDAVRELTATLGGTTTGLLTWDSLVSCARFGMTCSKLAPGRHAFHITGFGLQGVDDAAPGVVSVQAGLSHKRAASVASQAARAVAFHYANADLQA